jgi:hypothetical protein
MIARHACMHEPPNAPGVIMTRTTRTISTVAVAALFAVTMGCSTVRSLVGNSTGGKAAAKSQKDIAACEKMCELAGDADKNKAAVTACQKDCRN